MIAWKVYWWMMMVQAGKRVWQNVNTEVFLFLIFLSAFTIGSLNLKGYKKSVNGNANGITMSRFVQILEM